MEQRRLTLSVCFLVFICHRVYSTPVLGTGVQISGYKAGHCPLMTDFGQCSNMCIYDTDCEDDKKCCLNGCGGTSCVEPQQDPCLGYRCPKQGQTCISLLTHPVCLCNTQCPDIYQPVCGNDGNTYSNKCYMDAHACELELTIAMVPCDPLTDDGATDTPLSTDSPMDEGQGWVFPGVGEEDEDEDEDEEYSDDEWEEDDESDEEYIPSDDGETELLSTDFPPVNTSGIGEDDNDTGFPGDEKEDGGEPAPPVLVEPPGEVVAYVGDATNIECNVQADPEPAILWKKDDLIMYPGQTYDNIFVSEKGVLHFSSAQKEMSGNYLCIAANSAGSLAVLYALSVIDRPATEAIVTDSESPENEATTASVGEGGSMDAACYMPFDKGTCHQYMAVWTYNMQTRSCEVQAYGGCGGNENRFAEYEQCRATCPDMPTNQCEHPLETGPCRGYFPRWGWDPATKDCVKFVYGGCLGNDNNFDRQEDCLAVCSNNEVLPPTEAPEVPSEEQSPDVPNEQRSPPDLALEECEDCEPEKDLHDSYCRNDFVLSGTISQLTPGDDGYVSIKVVIDGLYKHGGLQMTQSDSVGLAILKMKYNGECLCPGISTDGTKYFIMGKVEDGVGVLDSSSYLRSYTSHRFSKVLHIKQNSVYICNPMLSPFS
ncbi:WAP, Kazal, immunoglobulin, Kunitz and NTR domain-containing protein 1-like [Ptychodera flava]|uniref:WAP, Kazal, immunoglobulin, Kunitz and NTR domain-containing protein 1-like n=1 Tax=Ptychodera flava TaxID=63121 RepID=UPI003969FB25